MGTNWRELDCRQAEGGRLRVRLLWNQRSHNLAVEVNDRGLEQVLAVRDASAARNAFMHPFAYMRCRPDADSRREGPLSRDCSRQPRALSPPAPA